LQFEPQFALRIVCINYLRGVKAGHVGFLFFRL
jgi:hypothetical protein